MTISTTHAISSRAAASDATRWGQLIFGIICMVMIANLQYGWTLFVNPIDQKYHWGRAAIQVAFTIFVLTETWLVPFEGYLIDKFGPRVMVCGSGVLVAVAWIINSVADSLFLLYLGAAIGGIGAGVIYGASVGNALKWFPDRRGLAAGLTAAGFGAGSALTVIPIASMIQSSGYQAAFLWFGLGQGIVVILVALLLRAPQPGEVVSPATPAVQQTRRDYGPAEVLKTPVFWVMYAMFVMVGAGGLMAIAQLAPIANDYKIASVPVSILGLTLPALTFALTIDRVLNGICRPFFGWVSDHIGRENTMFIAFFVEGLGIYAFLLRGQSGPVRGPVGHGVLRLGRDLFALSSDLHRHIWQEIRDNELWHALYGEGDGVPAGPLSKRVDQCNRQLARCVLCRGDPQHCRGSHGARRVAADATPSYGLVRPRQERKSSRDEMQIILCGTVPSSCPRARSSAVSLRQGQGPAHKTGTRPRGRSKSPAKN